MSKPLSRRIEALLFTREQALTIKALALALAADEAAIAAALRELEAIYAPSAMELAKVASGYRLQLRSDYFDDIQALAASQPPRYSRAFWETLAFIAYHQPVTRGDIDSVRGVTTSSGIYRQLFDLEWISVIGQREVPGRPELLATTQTFLDDFGIASPQDLPALPDDALPEEPEDTSHENTE